MKHINYKNDFEFLLKIMGKDGAVRPVPQYRWSVVFSVGGVCYECSLRDGNAAVKGDTIVCRLQDHGFGCGELKAEFREWIPNKDWLDGVVDVSTPIDTDIELWEEKSDEAEEMVSGSVVSAYFVYDAYLTAKANGYTGTAEEYYDAITSVVGIAEAEAGRVSNEELRKANEQQRVREFDAMKAKVDNVYTKSESDARYERKNQYEYVCGQKQRLITIDRPFDSITLRAFECGGYLWIGNNGNQKVARIDLTTEEVKILNAPNNTRINRVDKHCITQDEEGNFYWCPATTSDKIYKCDADLNIIQSFTVGNWDGGWYFGGFLWNYSSNILKKMDLNGTTLKTFEIGTVSNNLIMQKIYGTQHGVFAGKFIWDNETDEIYTLEKSVSLSETHLGGVTLGGWSVPELVTGYDASNHTFTFEESVNKSTTLGISNYTGRVDERCVVGNINCRDIAISFSKGYYVNTINAPLPVPFNTPYYAMDGWMIWSEKDKIKILNLLGEWK